MLQSQQCPSYTSRAYYDVFDFHVVLMHMSYMLKNNWPVFPSQSKLSSMAHATAERAGCQDRGQSIQQEEPTSLHDFVGHISWHFCPPFNSSKKSTRWATRNAPRYLLLALSTTKKIFSPVYFSHSFLPHRRQYILNILILILQKYQFCLILLIIFLMVFKMFEQSPCSNNP